MRLLIISHTPHYIKLDQIVGWGSTVREIDHLAALFNEVVHIAPLHAEPDPGSSLPYTSPKVRVRPVNPAGGNRLNDKLSILKQIPSYVRVMLEELKTADVVHVRCPAAISLVALFVLLVKRKPQYRWVKYAGNWKPTGKEALSYSLQRLILKFNIINALTTVNGNWKNLPGHFVPFVNPSMSDEELIKANIAGQQKKLSPPYRILFVGRLEGAKGVGRIIQIARLLHEQELPFEIDLVGDGFEKAKWENEANNSRLAEKVKFHGWLPRIAINAHYEKAHFILLPSIASEGWPKVLSEAMAYGTVVLASDISSIPEVIELSGAGYAFNPHDIRAYSDAIINLVENPETWHEKSRNAMHYSSFYTYSYYLTQLRKMINYHWNIDL